MDKHLRKNYKEELSKKAIIRKGIFCGILAGMAALCWGTKDRTGPQIDVQKGAPIDGNMVTSEKLLTGAKAIDKVDGDVTSRLYISSFHVNSDNTMSVVYAATDKSGNLSTCTVILDAEGNVINKKNGTGNEKGNTVLPSETGGVKPVPATTEPVSEKPEETTEKPTEGEPAEPTQEEQTPEVTEPVVTPTEPQTEPQTEPYVEPVTDAPVLSGEAPVISLLYSDVTYQVGEDLGIFTIVTGLSDDKDTKEMLEANIEIDNLEALAAITTPGEAQYHYVMAVPGGEATLTYRVLDSDGHYSEPQTIIIRIQ